MTLPPARPTLPPPPLDDDMVDTRPMPKRTRDDFVSIQKLSATIDELARGATPWQVATRCASAVADALEAHAVVIHQHDARRRELRSIGVHGPNAGDLLGTTSNVDDDYVAMAVLTNKKPLFLRLDGSLPRFVPDRHRLLGTSRSLAAFPVIGGDGCAGIIEVVGVGEERQQGIIDACQLVAQRLVAAFDALKGQRRFRQPDPGLLVVEARPVRPTPTTFPKRAPTLLCRPTRAGEDFMRAG